jgi:hypothetical protein
MRKTVGLGCVGLLMAGVVLSVMPTTACTTHQCDPPPEIDVFDSDDGGSGPIDPNTWESNPLESPWLNFHGMQTYTFHLPPEFAGRRIALTQPYVSVADDPVGEASPWVAISGNATEWFLQPGPNGAPSDPPVISVLNDTCAQYWLRVVVTFAAVNDTDGGTEAAVEAGRDQ